MEFEANFTKASLLVPETRIVAGLMLEGIDEASWKQRIVDENILQKRTINTATSYATIARNRLRTMAPDLWQIVYDADQRAATQAALAATVKFSTLLGLFMRTRLSDQYRRMEPTLEPHVWDGFIEDVSIDHPNIAKATDGTRAKLRQNAFRILHEAGYIGNSKTRLLQHVRIEPQLAQYLDSNNEDLVRQAMEVAR